MKLWFKVFISALFLVIAAINATALVVLSNNQHMTITRERSRAVSSHEFICASISNNITYQRMKSEAFMLSKDDIDKVIEHILSQQLEENALAIISDSENNISYYGEEKPDIKTLSEKITSEDNLASIILDCGENTYMFVGSISSFEGKEYKVFTANNITEVYNERNKELFFVQILSVVLAAVIAVILLLLIKLLFRPLGRINKTINKIASGDYSLRVSTSGSEEFQQLANNVNSMAVSVEENYNRIESIAEDRKRFIDSLSHEMKTPLTSILGFADILRIKKNVTPDELNEYSSIIVEESKRLKAISGKLMELDSSGDSELELNPVRTDVILNELSIVFEPMMKAKSITLFTHIEPLIINADADLFKSVIYNFVDNAVKASFEGGKIELTCRSEGEYAVITVRDYGMGIAEEDKKRIFEPFYMADKVRSRKLGGAGLGLALCAEIAKKHNAKIELESELGKGTIISICIKQSEGKINEQI